MHRNDNVRLGVLAGGLGVRLRAMGNTIKPLTIVAGQPLIMYPIKAFAHHGIAELVIAISEGTAELKDFIVDQAETAGLAQTVVNNGMGSASGTAALTRHFREGDVYISTCDTVISGETVEKLITVVHNEPTLDVAVIVTPYQGEDNPVWVALDASDGVCQLGKDIDESEYVFGNVRWLSRKAVQWLIQNPARTTSDSAWLGDLISQPGMKTLGVIAEGVFDIDTPADVERVEEWLIANK